MIMLYPTLIQPIFNKVEELEPGELRSAIEQLAQSTGFPLTALYKIDGMTTLLPPPCLLWF
jgi:STE24 endopeptidase